MKKKNILNLIKYYSENNDAAFKNEAYEIATDFDKNGDSQLAEYIMALMSTSNIFTTQNKEYSFKYLEKIDFNNDCLPLPPSIEKDIVGIINAINSNIGVNKFLFEGAPGTGKTECSKHIARILQRDLYSVDFSKVIDSKLGQTQKNISELFAEINSCPILKNIIILFDEIDALAMDRTNANDVREMGRTTSQLLKSLDSMNQNAIIIATTNLMKYFDKALSRRFDYIVNFDKYDLNVLVDIGKQILEQYLNRFNIKEKNMRLAGKILERMQPVLMPGDLKNAIRTSLAFSDKSDSFDYMRRLYIRLCGDIPNMKELQNLGFTLREIEILTCVPKSSVGRNLRGD